MFYKLTVITGSYRTGGLVLNTKIVYFCKKMYVLKNHVTYQNANIIYLQKLHFSSADLRVVVFCTSRISHN